MKIDLEKERHERKGELRLILTFLPEGYREMSVLDIGGGYGITAKLLGFKDATIIDFDNERLAAAKRFGFKAKKINLNYLAKEDFSRWENRFDIVLCSNNLEHVKYPAHIINFAYWCTRKYFISITPNDRYKFSERVRRLLGRPTDPKKQAIHEEQKTPHIPFFSYSDLVALHKYAGFHIEKAWIDGKPGLISKNMSGEWAFLCVKKPFNTWEMK